MGAGQSASTTSSLYSLGSCLCRPPSRLLSLISPPPCYVNEIWLASRSQAISDSFSWKISELRKYRRMNKSISFLQSPLFGSKHPAVWGTTLNFPHHLVFPSSREHRELEITKQTASVFRFWKHMNMPYTESDWSTKVWILYSHWQQRG